MPIYYQLKIGLEDSKPEIYRKVLIDPELKLSKLHKIIQDLFDWTDSHLHHFFTNDIFYVNPKLISCDEPRIVSYNNIKLSDVLNAGRKKFYYEYDFGDSWVHIITLEGIKELEETFTVKCIDGKRNSPPEDCGGIPGFYEMLKILTKPNTEEYKELIEWLGGEYDPLYFDLEERNYLLKEFNKKSSSKKSNKSKEDIQD